MEGGFLEIVYNWVALRTRIDISRIGDYVAIAPPDRAAGGAMAALTDLSPERWHAMSDQQMCKYILAHYVEMTPDKVTTEFIRGIRNYRELYPTYAHNLLSQMVLIDQSQGINTCSCGQVHTAT